MRVDDFVCLGCTYPVASKKYGMSACMAGYSEELNQFLRVYPLMANHSFIAQGKYQLELVKNPLDSRVESWKLAEAKEVLERVSDDRVQGFLDSHCAPSIKSLNEKRLSLGVLKVSLAAPAYQTPYLVFYDKEEYRHRLQLRETNSHSHLNRCEQDNPTELYKFWRSIHLNKKGREMYFILGNMSFQRTAWLIINILSFKKK